MPYSHQCPYCGAYLDPGEQCGCDQQCNEVPSPRARAAPHEHDQSDTVDRRWEDWAAC